MGCGRGRTVGEGGDVMCDETVSVPIPEFLMDDTIRAEACDSPSP